MKAFVFQNVDRLTGRWHSEGGLLVIAEDREHVLSLLQETNTEEWGEPMHPEPSEDEWARVVEYELMDMEVPRVFVFPNAGCC